MRRASLPGAPGLVIVVCLVPRLGCRVSSMCSEASVCRRTYWAHAASRCPKQIQSSLLGSGCGTLGELLRSVGRWCPGEVSRHRLSPRLCCPCVLFVSLSLAHGFVHSVVLSLSRTFRRRVVLVWATCTPARLISSPVVVASLPWATLCPLRLSVCLSLLSSRRVVSRRVRLHPRFSLLSPPLSLSGRVPACVGRYVTSRASSAIQACGARVHGDSRPAIGVVCFSRSRRFFAFAPFSAGLVPAVARV